MLSKFSSWGSKRLLNASSMQCCSPMMRSWRNGAWPTLYSPVMGNRFGFSTFLHATTVVNVRKGNQVAMVADGQVSLGNTVFKNTAKKLRKLNDGVVCGFAGSAADCLTLIELLEKEFEKYPGQTLRACLSLA